VTSPFPETLMATYADTRKGDVFTTDGGVNLWLRRGDHHVHRVRYLSGLLPGLTPGNAYNLTQDKPVEILVRADESGDWHAPPVPPAPPAPKKVPFETIPVGGYFLDKYGHRQIRLRQGLKTSDGFDANSMSLVTRLSWHHSPTSEVIPCDD